MSSAPVTFSGFNNINFASIVSALMQQASQPLTALQTQQSDLQSQVSNYSTLSSNLTALDTATSALDNLNNLSTFAATSTNPSAIAVSGSAQAAGEYDIVVNSLARAQTTVSTSVSPDANTTAVATGGSMTIGGVAVNLTGSVTLQGLADAINATPGIGVNASVMQTGDTSFRLALTSSATGLANAFTVTNNLTGGAGVAFADTNGNGVSGDSLADNAINASDASITVNNVAITSSSNTFGNVIPGLSFTALQMDPTSTVSIDIAPDSSTLTTNMQAFVSAYNNLVSFLGSQQQAAQGNDPTSIGNDPLLQQVSSSLENALMASYGSGSVQQLAQIGLGFTETGTLELDTNMFQSAVASNSSDVQQLLAGTSGAFPTIDSLLQDYTDATGFIPTEQQQLTQESNDLSTQISDMQSRLAVQQTALQAEFTAAEEAISTLESQAGSLANLGSSLSGLTSSVGSTNSSSSGSTV